MRIGSVSICGQQNDQVVIIGSSNLAVKIFHVKIKNPVLRCPPGGLLGCLLHAEVWWSNGVYEISNSNIQ
ncbi:MAG: hypothetical protein DRG34_03365 [Deltaproteobacteria bacterium]|nr:MAG: hypothetical protein DRG34_03365 [Deltaproteobacteria bacterium]